MSQDYGEFYREEMGYRQLLGYPPASNLFAVRASCGDERLLETGMEYIRKFIRKVDPGGHLTVIGPADEVISRVADMYRKVLYIKHQDYSRLVLVKDRLEQYMEMNSGFKKIRIQFEFNH